MSTFTKPLTIKGLQVQSNFSIYKRVANLILLVIGVSIAINLWLLSSEQAAKWHNNQASQLGRSLAQQTALALTQAVATDDKAAINQRLTDIVGDPHVSHAALFDGNGRLIDNSGEHTSVLDSVRQSQQDPLVFVEEIRDQENTIGYVRLFLVAEQVMRYHDDYQQQLFEQTKVLMLLAAIVGGILTRMLYKFRQRHHTKQTKPA